MPYMGVFEITQAQYSNVMGTAPSFYAGATRPVESVSWNTIRGGTWPGGTPSNDTFMGRLRAKTGRAFDLPTEAQWEYACRAGTTGAWKNGNLYDMHGNVWEFCLDWYGAYTGDATDPGGAASGSLRVYRGGSFSSGAGLCRSAYECGYIPDNQASCIGFRLALSAGQ